MVVLDDLRSGTPGAVPDGAELVEGAVQDPALVGRVVASGVRARVHFAASIEAESMRRREAFFGNNTAATLRLLETLVTGGVDRFVLSSTAAVHGDRVRHRSWRTTPPSPRMPTGSPSCSSSGRWPGRDAGCTGPRCATSTPRGPPGSAASATTPRPTSSRWCYRWPPGAATTSRTSPTLTSSPSARSTATSG